MLFSSLIFFPALEDINGRSRESQLALILIKKFCADIVYVFLFCFIASSEGKGYAGKIPRYLVSTNRVGSAKIGKLGHFSS